MVTFKYSITGDDYKNYIAFVLWEGEHNRKKRRNYYLRQFLPLLGFLFAFYYTGVFERSIFIYIGLGLLIFTAVLVFTGVRSRFTKVAETFAENPENRMIFTEKLIHISDEGIRITEEHLDTHYRWQAFVKKKENDSYYFLFLSSNQALIIPKRFLKDQQDKSQADKILTRNISFEAEFSGLEKS